MSCKKLELYRNPDRARIAGVCAGIADYFGWETWLVRILVVSGVLFGMPFLILGYFAGWFILDKTPKEKRNRQPKQANTNCASNEVKRSQERDVINESIKVKSRIWQAGEPPKQALYDIGRKFHALEKKLQSIEQHVTSAEFTVSREINNL